MSRLFALGYASEDIISSVFRVCRNHTMPEYLMLEFIQVNNFIKACVVFIQLIDSIFFLGNRAEPHACCPRNWFPFADGRPFGSSM